MKSFGVLYYEQAHHPQTSSYKQGGRISSFLFLCIWGLAQVCGSMVEVHPSIRSVSESQLFNPFFKGNFGVREYKGCGAYSAHWSCIYGVTYGPQALSKKIFEPGVNLPDEAQIRPLTHKYNVIFYSKCLYLFFPILAIFSKNEKLILPLRKTT